MDWVCCWYYYWHYYCYCCGIYDELMMNGYLDQMMVDVECAMFDSFYADYLVLVVHY